MDEEKMLRITLEMCKTVHVCPFCGFEDSSLTSKCPRCGRELTLENLKKELERQKEGS